MKINKYRVSGKLVIPPSPTTTRRLVPKKKAYSIARSQSSSIAHVNNRDSHLKTTKTTTILREIQENARGNP